MLKIVDFGDFIFAKIFFARSTLKTLIIEFERKKSMSLNPAHGEVYSIQHYVIKFLSDL